MSETIVPAVSYTFVAIIMIGLALMARYNHTRRDNISFMLFGTAGIAFLVSGLLVSWVVVIGTVLALLAVIILVSIAYGEVMSGRH